MKFENISLPVFNPYSGKFAGYNIAKGKLFTDLHYQIDNRKLEAQHKIRIDQLEWGEATASKEEATLPVKFATSLLKDADGVISLEIPVSGTLDDPTFRVGPIVWQIIKNILTKAVTAPFKALGALFKGAEEAQFVDFAPGSADARSGRCGTPGRARQEPRAEAGPAARGADRRRRCTRRRRPWRRRVTSANCSRRRAKSCSARSAPTSPRRCPRSKHCQPEQQDKVLTALYTQLAGAEPVVPEPAEPADGVSRKDAKAQAGQARLAWLEKECRSRAVAAPATWNSSGSSAAGRTACPAHGHGPAAGAGLPRARRQGRRQRTTGAIRTRGEVRLRLSLR